MPIYPYQCDACGHAFDEIQMMSEPPLKKCPACKRKKLRRLFGTPNVIVRYSPKSVMSLAEQNTRELADRVGKENVQQALRKKVYGKGGRKLKLKEGMKVVPDTGEKSETPWWRSGEVEGTGPRMDKPLDVTKVKDPKKFILKGDKT